MPQKAAASAAPVPVPEVNIDDAQPVKEEAPAEVVEESVTEV